MSEILLDSDSLNHNGDVVMNNNIEVIPAQVDSNEKAINAGLAGHKAEFAGHKAELEGHKYHVKGNFTALFAQMEASRKVSVANHQAALDRMDSDRKLWEANNKATLARMDADRKLWEANNKAIQERMDVSQRNLEDKIESCANNVKLWVIVTLISVVVGGASIIATGFAMIRVLSGS